LNFYIRQFRTWLLEIDELVLNDSSLLVFNIYDQS